MMTKKIGQDQAESLREKLTNNKNENITKYPPRSEVHKHKRSKRKMKVKYPLIRLLVITFIFLPLMVLSISYYLEHKNKTFVVDNQREFEQVNVNYSNNSNSYSEDQNLKEEMNSVEEENSTQNEQPSNDEQVSKDDGTKVEDSIEMKDKEEINQPTTENNDKSAPQYKIISHKVQPGETLFRISMKYYNSREGEKIISDYNNLNGNEIYEGQILKIPLLNEKTQK